MTKDSHLTLRTTEQNKEYLEKLGRGNRTDGFETLVRNYQNLMKTLTPSDFSEQEIMCIAGACKSWLIGNNIKYLNQMLAGEVEDYFKHESVEANQWKVNRPELLEKIQKLNGPEAFALIQHALETVFN